MKWRAVMRARSAVALALAAVLFAPMATADATQPRTNGADQPPTVTRTAPSAPLIPYSSRLSLSPVETPSSPHTDLSRTTLAPPPSDIGGVDEVEIAPRKTLMLSSESSWEKGFDNLAAAFRTLDEIALAAGLGVSGRPFAIFTQTEERSFKFEAMLPVTTETANEDEVREAIQQALTEFAATNPDGEDTQKADDADREIPAIRLGVSPSGKAFRFVHASAYDDIDAAYEAITTYLDSKNIVVRDAFIEEYVTDLTLPTDESLEVYIYVQPQEKAETSKGHEPVAPDGADPSSTGSAAEDDSEPKPQ